MSEPSTSRASRRKSKEDEHALELAETGCWGNEKGEVDDDGSAELSRLPTARSRFGRRRSDGDVSSPILPPSFAESQFQTIVRRQAPHHSGLKRSAIPTRFPNVENDWEFAGWGSSMYLDLNPQDLLDAQRRLDEHRATLGRWRASAGVANDVLGSVFYALPAVAGVAGVFSPLSLFIAGLFLFLWRPLLVELGSAIRLNGGNYTYILNVSNKTLALVAAAATLLDGLITCSVSSATAASYLHHEVVLPFPELVISIIILFAFCGLALLGIRESTGVAFTIVSFHALTMLALLIASWVHWGRIGNAVLDANWRDSLPGSASGIVHAIFNGVCLGLLGLTGFECIPNYIEEIRPEAYAPALRILATASILLNAPVMLAAWAVLPRDALLLESNILSNLAEIVQGRALRIIVACDAMVVLCAGVLTGVLSVCGLIDRLTRDRVLPNWFLRTMPFTGSPYFAILSVFVLSIIMSAVTGFSLSTLSSAFAFAFLSIMLLFAVSAFLLKFNRNRLLRKSRASLTLVVLALALMIAVLAGNIALSPTSLGYFAAYFAVIALVLITVQNQMALARTFLWLYDMTPLHSWRATSSWGGVLVSWIMRLKRESVICYVRTDEVAQIVNAILYVKRNEGSCGNIKIVHCYDDVNRIPSELEANIKILDEAFPAIQIDLVFVQAPFSPIVVEAVSEKLGIPKGLSFMSAPGHDHLRSVGEYKGLRVISL